MKIILRKYKGEHYFADNKGNIIIRKLTKKQINEFISYELKKESANK